MTSVTPDEDLATTEAEDAVDEYFSILPNRLLVASGNAIKLYLVLSTYTNPKRPTVWPSRKTLASKLGLAKPASIDRYIKELEDLGAVTVVPRYRADGGQSSSGYRLHQTRTPRAVPGGRGIRSEGPPPIPYRGQLNLDTNMNLEKDIWSSEDDRPESAEEIHEEISDPGPGELDGQTDALEVLVSIEDAWVEFWTSYPRKAAKKAARKAWDKAIKETDPSTLTAAAKAYAADPGRSEQYTKHATTWLNGGCWEDAPLPGRETPWGSPPADRAADMWNVQMPINEDGTVTTPSGRRIPSGVIAAENLALD